MSIAQTNKYKLFRLKVIEISFQTCDAFNSTEFYKEALSD